MENDIELFSKEEMQDKYQFLHWANNHQYPYTRTNYISKYGFAGLCKEFIDDLVSLLKGKKVLCVMSGTGYLEKILSDKGIDIIASDTMEWSSTYYDWKPYIDIEKIDGKDAVEKYKDWADIVIMSWPYMDNNAYRIALLLKKYNIPLLYIGEWYTGSTANDNFFDLVSQHHMDTTLCKNYFRFFGIYDKPVLIKWIDYSKFQTLLKNFSKEFSTDIDWNKLSAYEYLPEEFIREYSDKVNWDLIFRYQKLSDEFIEEFSNKVDWDFIAESQCLSEEFIRKYLDKFNLDIIVETQDLPFEMMKELSDKLNWDVVSNCKKYLSDEFVQEFSDKLNWDIISRIEYLPEEFIRKNADKLNWHLISIYPMSEDFIREFSDKVDWYAIFNYHNLSDDFIKEFSDKIE